MRALAQYLYAVLLLAGALLVPSFSFAEEGSDDYPAKFSSNTAAVNDVLYDHYQDSLDAAEAWWRDAYPAYSDCTTTSETQWSGSYWFHTLSGCGGGTQTAPPTCSYPGAPGGGSYDHTVNMCVVGEVDPVDPPEPVSCTQGEYAGWYTSDVAFNAGTTYCTGGCEVKVKQAWTPEGGGLGEYQGSGYYTGATCGSDDGITQTDTPPGIGDCDLKPSSIPGCFRCGDETICPDTFPPNGCIRTHDGHLFCADDSASQPMVDTDSDGQPDSPAPKQGDITYDNDTYDYSQTTSTDTSNYYYYGTGQTAPDGTTQKGDSLCGGAGQPECGSGDMPNQPDIEYPGEGMYDDLTGRDNLADYQAPLTSESQLTDKFSVIDTRACSPLDFGTIEAFGQSYGPVTIDLCQYADWVRAIIFALLAGFAIIGIWETFNRTIRGA